MNPNPKAASFLKRSVDAGRAAVGDALRRVRNDVRGARVLAEWLGAGGQPVDRQLAESRARVCMACPLNRPKRAIEAKIAAGIREHEEMRNRTSLKLPGEERLHTCNACGCYLKLKVWVPMKHLLTTSSPDQFPSNCWMHRENAGAKAEGAPPAPALKPGKQAPMSFVVQRQSAMGDAIMASAVCTAFYGAGVRVGFHTAPGLREIFRHHPHLEVVDDPGAKVVSLDGAWERLPNRKDVHRAEEYWRVAKQQIPVGDFKDPYSKSGALALPDTLPAPVLALTDEEKSDGYIETMLCRRPLIGIVPGSKRYSNRSIDDRVWSAFAGLAPGACLWLGEQAAPSHSNITDLGAGSLRRLMRLIHACDIVVSADTGPAHMALALGRKLVIVQGPFLAGRMFFHTSAPWRAVAANVPCIGCGDFTCMSPAKGEDACANPDPVELANAVEAML